ncbi:MAG TPA: hypothetical protein VFU99_09605 [Gaiellaceae bacterium]|nr:hypothetical protein [Gaiellaceae bacterium]
MTRRRLARTFWLGAAALLVAAALVAIVALLRGELTDTDAHILLTLGVLFVTGAAALAGLALVDSGRQTLVGWTVAAVAPVELTVLVYWIWSGSEGDDTISRLGTTTLLLLVGQVAIVTQLLLLSNRRLLALVLATDILVVVAVGGAITALWTEPDDTLWAKLLAAAWILAALGWFLLPVLQRFTAAGAPPDERVLDELDGVELVATRASAGIDVRLARGERLLLRRR